MATIENLKVSIKEHHETIMSELSQFGKDKYALEQLKQQETKFIQRYPKSLDSQTLKDITDNIRSMNETITNRLIHIEALKEKKEELQALYYSHFE